MSCLHDDVVDLVVQNLGRDEATGGVRMCGARPISWSTQVTREAALLPTKRNLRPCSRPLHPKPWCAGLTPQSRPTFQCSTRSTGAPYGCGPKVSWFGQLAVPSSRAAQRTPSRGPRAAPTAPPTTIETTITDLAAAQACHQASQSCTSAGGGIQRDGSSGQTGPRSCVTAISAANKPRIHAVTTVDTKAPGDRTRQVEIARAVSAANKQTAVSS